MPRGTESEERAFRALEVTENHRFRAVEDASIQTQLDMFRIEWRYEVLAAGGNPGAHDANVAFMIWLVSRYPDFAGLAKSRNLLF